MIAIIRNSDNRVMNIRESADWRKGLYDRAAGQTKGEHLLKLYEDLENTPGTEPTKRQELQAAIDRLQGQWDQRLLHRREICARRYDGVAADYSTIDVPISQEKDFLSARFIEYNGENLTCDMRSVYTLEDNVITCTSGWVVGNERLLEDDVTNFSGETLTEPIFFQLWWARHEGTQAISVQLLVRNEDEEFSPFPENLQPVRCGKYGPVCEGRVNVDNTITLGRF